MAKTDRKKAQVEGCTGVLEIKLGACLTAPTRRFHADLLAVAHALNRSRTLAVRAWERWREDNPDWHPPRLTTKAGEAKTFRGRAVYANQPLPDEAPEFVNPDSGKPVKPTTWLYHRLRAAAPAVASNVLASVSQAVYASLRSNTPWDHWGEAVYRWQAILLGEASRTRYSSLDLPVPHKDATLALSAPTAADRGRVLVSGAAAKDLMARLAKSSAVLRVPLFSTAAGRANTAHVCRIEVRQLSRGNRRVLRKVAAGEWKYQDSRLVYKEGRGSGRGAKRPRGGAWFFQLTYRQPRFDLGLDRERVARLTALPKGASHPFRVDGPEFVEGGGARPSWTLGDVKTLVCSHQRLATRRAEMRRRYHDAGSARRGHGRARFEPVPQAQTRAVRDLAERFVDSLVAELVKFCRRHDCGTVDYAEPSLAWRPTQSWFAGAPNPIPNGAPVAVCFDWTSLMSHVAHKCDLYGIKLLVNGRLSKGKDSSPPAEAVA